MQEELYNTLLPIMSTKNVDMKPAMIVQNDKMITATLEFMLISIFLTIISVYVLTA